MTVMAESDDRKGTQSIERATSLLREIASRPKVGWQLADLAARCNLGRSTAHRMLACLVRQRMVTQRSSDRHYLPGPMLFELGLAIPEYGELQHAARSRLAALAKRLGCSAFMHFRSGDDFVCAVRAGMEPKATTIFPGTRRPLVLSAGGVAMLLALPVPEARATIRRNYDVLVDATRARRKAIREMLYRSHEVGFAINVGHLTPGMNGYGLAICDSTAGPVAGIVAVAPERLLPLKNLPSIRRALRDTAEELEEFLK
jgi:DNA-binding IclR family transcriptional regulator